jgi:3-oxoacyl-[acyl-carrier protein] reductase
MPIIIDPLKEQDMSITTSRDKRVAVVTGGSGGIGRAVAGRLAATGAAVVVHYAGNAERAEEVVQEIAALGGKAAAIGGDVADEQAMVRLFDETERLFGGVDVVVHAAGRMDLAPLVDFDLDTLDEMLRTNVRGTFVVDQQAARRIRPRGSILNFSSSVLGRILPNYTGYAASKGAVEAMTFILASEMRGRDINVNAIAPGPTATPLFLEGKDEETIARFAHAVPMDRLGTPADIAEAAVFLTSPAGHWINGQTIRANGGMN